MNHAFQVIRNTPGSDQGRGDFKVAELIAYSMFINLFLLGEVFKDITRDGPPRALQYCCRAEGAQRPCADIWTAMIFQRQRLLPLLMPRRAKTT